MRSVLTIGRVAKLAGVNVETIRYDQRRRLLAEPTKPTLKEAHLKSEAPASE